MYISKLWQQPKKWLNAHNGEKKKRRGKRDKTKKSTITHDYFGHPVHSSKKPNQTKPRDFYDLRDVTLSLIKSKISHPSVTPEKLA